MLKPKLKPNQAYNVLHYEKQSNYHKSEMGMTVLIAGKCQYLISLQAWFQ